MIYSVKRGVGYIDPGKYVALSNGDRLGNGRGAGTVIGDSTERGRCGWVSSATGKHSGAGGVWACGRCRPDGRGRDAQ